MASDSRDTPADILDQDALVFAVWMTLEDLAHLESEPSHVSDEFYTQTLCIKAKLRAAAASLVFLTFLFGGMS